MKNCAKIFVKCQIHMQNLRYTVSTFYRRKSDKYNFPMDFFFLFRLENQKISISSLGHFSLSCFLTTYFRYKLSRIIFTKSTVCNLVWCAVCSVTRSVLPTGAEGQPSSHSPAGGLPYIIAQGAILQHYSTRYTWKKTTIRSWSTATVVFKQQKIHIFLAFPKCCVSTLAKKWDIKFNMILISRVVEI